MLISVSPASLRFRGGSPQPSQTQASEPSTPPSFLVRKFKKEQAPPKISEMDSFHMGSGSVIGDDISQTGLEDLPDTLVYKRASGVLERRNTADFTAPNLGPVRPQVRRRNTSSAVDEKPKSGHRRKISKEVRMRPEELRRKKALENSLKRAQEVGKDSTKPKADFSKKFQDLGELFKKF